MQDASFLVTVPAVVAEVPALRRDPVVGYLRDDFTHPYPFQTDVVLDVGPYVDQIVSMLACHASQVFEWLPFNRRMEDEVPNDVEQRIAWLKRQYRRRQEGVADRLRRQLVDAYGAERGGRVEYVEAFEISEYASSLDEEARQRLFPRGM